MSIFIARAAGLSRDYCASLDSAGARFASDEGPMIVADDGDEGAAQDERATRPFWLGRAAAARLPAPASSADAPPRI